MIYMEEELIEQVRANPILYDVKNRKYRNQTLRKETWDEIGENLGKPGELCKETWNKLRNAYTNALNRRRSRFGQVSFRRMPKWTFEDQMAFLPVSLASRPRHRRSSIGFSLDETQEQPDNEHSDNEASIAVGDEDIKPSPLRIANDGLSTDQSDIAAHHFQTSNFQEFATPRSESKSQNTRLEATMNELVAVMKNNSEMLSQHLTSQNKSTMTSQNNNNCTHDEDEMYFLSLAKFVKKLNPAEKIRVKGDVSQIVFQAEFRNLQSDGQNNHQQQQQELPQLPSTSQNASADEQYLSETGILNPKTEKE